jgi:glycosyltransferase involved in cell wall biosynthesis
VPKILRIINRFNLGGPTFNAAYLSKYLPSEYETMLVGGSRDETEDSSEFIVESLGLKPTILPEMKRELSVSEDRKAYRKLKELIHDFQPDIVHTHASKAGALGRLAASKMGVKCIVHTFHGHVFHSYFGKIKTRFYLNTERYLAKKSDAIIAISNIQKRELTERFKIAHPDKFSVINLGFDLSKFHHNQHLKREKFRKEWSLGSDICVAIIGRLVPIKDHIYLFDRIVNIQSKLKQKITLLVVGDGELRGELESYANLHFDKNKVRVIFTSWIKEVDEVIAGSDIITLSSKNEGTPVTLIEAQAGSKPIVSVEVGGIADIVKSNETALISKREETTKFEQNLLDLIQDEKLRQKLSEKGLQFVEKQFHYERLCADMDKLYKDILSKK